MLAGLPLVDHHCHGVLLTELDRAGVERGMTESDALAPPGTTMFDTPVGLVVRRWCAPVLGLEPHADAAAYLAVRARLGTAESTRRLLRAALLSDVLVDTGLRGPDFVEPAGVPVVLLHCHPYHRQAAWLAQVFPHVHADVGLALNHVGAGAPGYLAECLELTPFAKLLFSTDAFGLPELFCTGAALFREAFGRVLDSWIAHGACSTADAERIARLLGAANARRVYWLESR